MNKQQPQLRTEQHAPTQAPSGKWSVNFNTYRGHAGTEYLASQCTSGAMFETEDEAYAAGNRALDILEKTGAWPNMCEAF